MRVHFIAVGGSAMHNLAIALHQKGFKVSGSDDEIFEPSKSRLKKHGLLPLNEGWDTANITSDLDAIILGMHARKDNPELLEAQRLGLNIYSYPEYLYEQTKDKKRVVIGGSHGKTTTTAMVMHVLMQLNMDFDYMVGAQLDGFDTMVKLSKEAPIAIFEGDEYLSSPIDLTPKFHWYKPHIAMLTGIAWDHMNVFPTWENYISQFSIFADSIAKDGSLIYFDADTELVNIAEQQNNRLKTQAYDTIDHVNNNGQTIIQWNNEEYPMEVFGDHNLQNMNGARLICQELSISDDAFLKAMQSFKGAAKRLQLLQKNDHSNIYLDFAHSPSKLKATTSAMKQQFKDRQLIAVMELHTFSSLNQDFLPQYKSTMDEADQAIVYFNPEVLKHKKLPELSKETVLKAFDRDDLLVMTDSSELVQWLKEQDYTHKNLLIMTSGNLSGQDIKALAKELLS
ncbi:UDP-N-acetylmuramate--L-alanine ligase [Carboxylicivirga sp. M1479]|uniref:UDP-N-acetylmuramate--L-alanine ligase n=1 Tax=Carboxylicivirga sp. M1479 TaxID=2594476 RepID=UPI0011782556|nr:Mur ligase family protein [Carboxylicivirga sp. M1479]TRX71604.1 peptidoglycan synthetase [Carboxylicivirga sp. M1479]